MSPPPSFQSHPPVLQFRDDLALNNNLFVSPCRALTGNRSVGIETWVQNLSSPRIQSAQTQNQQASPRLAPLLPRFLPFITLSTFWETEVDLRFATVDQTFASNGIVDDMRMFSVVLNLLNLNNIRKVQHVVRDPCMFPYTKLKTALAKRYKLCENNCLYKLFLATKLGDRKLSELLREMHYLLDEYYTSDFQSQAVFRKSFHNKLPVQVRTILA